MGLQTGALLRYIDNGFSITRLNFENSFGMTVMADAYILDSDQSRIGCQKTIKALGMHFSCRPDMWAQVHTIKKKFQARFWMLRNLKKSGFTNEELVTVYKTMIRPVADYSAWYTIHR